MVGVSVPSSPKGQVVLRAIGQGAGPDPLQDRAEASHAAPVLLIGAADEVDQLVQVAPDPRAVKVQGEVKPARGPLRHESFDRPHRGVDVLVSVVFPVVVWSAAFSRVSVLHTVLVDKGNHEELDMIPQPPPRTIPGQYLLHQPFQAEGRDRLAGMEAGSQQHSMIRGAAELAQVEQLDIPALPGAAEGADPEMGAVTLAR